MTPLTDKGKAKKRKILKSMRKTYGSKKEAERIFWATVEEGKITGVGDKPKKKKGTKKK
jgi:hypothetical protein